MLTISRVLSASQAGTYHRSEFTSPEQSYYTKGKVHGEWQGSLAAEWGLSSDVTSEQFGRLANGQHPETGEPLVRHRQAFEYKNEHGETVRTMEHRAGWDATFSAPKSVSLTALVGGDERVRAAHRESVSIAVDELERYVQARIGGNHPAETTGRWVAAKFEHDSARPVDGYSAPQLHTHVVFFNVTQTADGKTRALQPKELYRSQKFATAVYQSELAWRLTRLGYEIDAGKNGAPEIRGYTQEYLAASSPRSRQIRQHLEARGLEGAGAAQIAAHRTRDAKATLGPHEMLARHQEVATTYGNQAQRVVTEARNRSVEREPELRRRHAHAAVTWARDRQMEREAVTDERDLARDALRRSMGQTTFFEIRADLARRIAAGEFVAVEPGSLTTRETLELEGDNIARMRAGQGHDDAIAGERDLERMESGKNLSESQRLAVVEILSSRDQVIGLQGTAGAGKTTSLAAIREVAERHGYKVEGLAPTSRAAEELMTAGIPSRTLQYHLARGETATKGHDRLFFVDESSLTSTRQVNDFLKRLRARDRVIFVGDTRQHQGVEAGRPFEQLQQAGMRTARLDQIVRQLDPGLKQAVEQLARGEVRNAIENLARQGRVHEISDPEKRMRAIAANYAAHKDNTLVVSPDNASRIEINRLVHEALRAAGKIAQNEYGQTVLMPRQELTGADRQWASRYEIGDVIRYSKGSRAVGVAVGEYVRVIGINGDRNLLMVRRQNGQEVSYDPRRLQGVGIYQECSRQFSAGERIQFTAPYKGKHVANRQLGTIEQIDAKGNLRIRLQSGRSVDFDIRKHPHLDYGYAVTSHSAQGATADRVLIHVDCESTHSELINSRLAYVAVSRARHDARIYTGDSLGLGNILSRSVSKLSALAREDSPVPSVIEKEQDAVEQPNRSSGMPPAQRAQPHDFDVEL
jgi:conjugative relaxase-like TrwC/TraI family protein